MEEKPVTESTASASPAGQPARASRKLAKIAACGIVGALVIGGGAAAFVAANSAPAPDPNPQPVESTGAGQSGSVADTIDKEGAASMRDADAAHITDATPSDADPAKSATSSNSSASSSDSSSESASSDSGTKLEYVAEDTEATSHTETVPAETETVTEKHTVCNTCKAIIDDDPEGHLASTGHAGYTRNVPIDYVRIKTPASTKTVSDNNAKHYLVCYRIDGDGNREEVSRQELGSAEEARSAAAAANATAASK